MKNIYSFKDDDDDGNENECIEAVEKLKLLILDLDGRRAVISLQLSERGDLLETFKCLS